MLNEIKIRHTYINFFKIKFIFCSSLTMASVIALSAAFPNKTLISNCSILDKFVQTFVFSIFLKTKLLVESNLWIIYLFHWKYEWKYKVNMPEIYPPMLQSPKKEGNEHRKSQWEDYALCFPYLRLFFCCYDYTKTNKWRRKCVKFV